MNSLSIDLEIQMSHPHVVLPKCSPIQPTRLGALRRSGLALLPALILSACATQQAVDEQTQPLREQVTQTEQAVQKLNASSKEQASAAQARDLAMLGQIEQMTIDIRNLRQQLGQLEQAQRAAEGSVREQAEAAKTREAAVAQRIEDLNREIAGLASAWREASAAQGAQLAQAQGQIDELIKTLPERVGKNEQRLDELLAQLRTTTEQLAATEQKRAADASAAVALTEMLGRTEHRLDEVAQQAAATEQKRAADAKAALAVADLIGKNEQRIDQLAMQSRQTTEQLAATERQRQADAQLGATVGERLAKAEAQVAQMAAGARGLAEEVASAVAPPIAAKVGGDLVDKLRQELAGQTAQQLQAREASQAATILSVAEADQAARATLADRLSRNEARVDDIAKLIDKALELVRYNEIMTNGKVVHTVTLTGDKTLYPLNLPDIHPEDAAKLSELIAYLEKMEKETHRKDYHLEIQGHADNIGMDDYAYQLAKARAEAVKRYLREKGAVSLNHMSVISYGATVPLDRNGKNNRRIAILVRVLDR